MAATYHVNGAGNGELEPSDVATGLGRCLAAIDSLGTQWSGSADPSTGASPAWGADEVGRRWRDDTDPANPIHYEWTRLTAGPTYGWRRLREPKLKVLTAPQAVTFTTASPALADVAWEDVSFATLLDGAGVQDSGDVGRTVRAVYIMTRVALGASETPGTTAAEKGYQGWREKGASTELIAKGKIADVYEYEYFWVGLDSTEKAQHQVKVGGGTANFRYAAWVLAIVEEG